MYEAYIDGLVQDCSNSSALAMELLQSCTMPWIWRNFVKNNTTDFFQMAHILSIPQWFQTHHMNQYMIYVKLIVYAVQYICALLFDKHLGPK